MFEPILICEKSKLLDSAKVAREERANERKRDFSAVKIQALVRRYLARCSLNSKIRSELDSVLQFTAQSNESDSEFKPIVKPAIQIFHLIQKLFLVFNQAEDMQRFEYLCRYIIHSLNSESMNKTVYLSVILSKELVIAWIKQVKEILLKCCQYFGILQPELLAENRMVTTLLHFVVTFTNSHGWKFLESKNGEPLKPGMEQLCKNCMGHLTSNGLYVTLKKLLIRGLCRTKPIFKSTTLTAILTIAFRPVLASDFSENTINPFIMEILSVPAIIHYISSLSLEILVQLMANKIFSQSLIILSNDTVSNPSLENLDGHHILCLLANLIQLGNVEKEGMVEETRKFIKVCKKLLNFSRKSTQFKKSNLSHWHPILGWFSQKIDPSLNDVMALVVRQLSGLWHISTIQLIFEPLFSYSSSIQPMESINKSPTKQISVNNGQNSSKNFLKKVLDKISTNNSPSIKPDWNIVIDTCQACSVYLLSLQTLTQLKMEIMAGLCFQDILLPRLWMLITHLGPQCGLKVFLDILNQQSNKNSPILNDKPLTNLNHPLFELLRLSCDTAKHIVTILDDIEMYEKEQPIPLKLVISISYFLNNLIFKLIWNGYIDVSTATNNELFNSTHSLLIMLHDRDCRRSYAPDNHWLIKDLKSSLFINDLNHNKSPALFLLQKMPHIIPHKERVVLFRKHIIKDKETIGVCDSVRSTLQNTGITVHRSRIIEDGYRQLSSLTPASIKGVIRVKFINEQGLDEAGIDQDGVFKEFLEEIIKRVFDPALNLFKATDEQKLYPSPTSYVQENHLALFEFVGKILGKAVYEGIVVDVPFASFFLSQLSGHHYSATYSSIDELPSLDPELYKSLTYVKYYDGDVSELDLTFSYDEDFMGKVITHELVPGGKAVAVTNENKISYLHLMAHFKMRVLIRDQSIAFIRGFKTIINSNWLEMFSAPELQKLISGDTNDIDLDDLRKHTHYYGGFHNNHRVIDWLWDILKKDFTPQERRLFLKFVTSCSKGPLLGFLHLEPPFSIRCVEVSEDQDSGDTVGSVLKGFFNIRKKDPIGRLPTSSTCFNLLKLPNYQKKNTLREKLRYSITSNTGFELS